MTEKHGEKLSESKGNKSCGIWYSLIFPTFENVEIIKVRKANVWNFLEVVHSELARRRLDKLESYWISKEVVREYISDLLKCYQSRDFSSLLRLTLELALDPDAEAFMIATEIVRDAVTFWVVAGLHEVKISLKASQSVRNSIITTFNFYELKESDYLKLNIPKPELIAEVSEFRGKEVEELPSFGDWNSLFEYLKPKVIRASGNVVKKNRSEHRVKKLEEEGEWREFEEMIKEDLLELWEKASVVEYEFSDNL